MKPFFRWLAVALAMPLIGCDLAPKSGKDNYLAYCADCHGSQGRGDGPAARGLPVQPADLTSLTARHGGVFPQVYVLSKIHGFGDEVEHHGAMPSFGPLLEGRLVFIETDKDVLTPTPEPLVELGEYIRSLQTK